MKSALLVALSASAVVGSANAGFVGFVANTRTVGAYTVIDVFAAVSNSADKFLNVYNASISTTVAGGFYQASGLANKSWKPDASNFNSTMDTLDSFMTAGAYSGAAYAGTYYASLNTAGDPNFTGTSWNATPGSAAATTVPALAGWYTGDPTSVDQKAILLSSMGVTNRTNSSYVIVGGGSGSGTSNSATYGIWCAHMVLSGSATLGTDTFFSAAATIKDSVTGYANQGTSGWAAPAPGAVALLGVAGVVSSRRRRA